MKKIITKIGIACLYTILTLAVAWTAFTVIGKIVNPTKYPMLFGYSEAGIASGSMEPTLSTGDHVVFHKQDNYALDDVVVYYDETDGIFVVHRIIGMNGDKFIVQGDYNPECDPNPVKLENIQGKVVLAIPNLQTFIYIAFGFTLAIVVIYFPKFIKSLKESKQEEGGNKQDEKQDIKDI